MIRPSEVNVDNHFYDTPFQNMQKEVLVRNVTVLSQAVAFERDDDRWHPFSEDDYRALRTATSQDPVTNSELYALRGLASEGYLEIDTSGVYSVTLPFLGVVGLFAREEAAAQVIAK